MGLENYEIRYTRRDLKDAFDAGFNSGCDAHELKESGELHGSYKKKCYEKYIKDISDAETGFKERG